MVCHQLRWAVPWVGSLCLVNVLLSPIDTDAQEKNPTKKAAAKMIDGIANRNRPPQLLERSGERYPLFPSDYDWNEQDRVSSAYGKLTNMTDELWEELVGNAEDQRYSLTLKNNSGTFALGNWTVGQFCRTLAFEGLVGVFDQHLPLDPNKPGHRIYLDIGIDTDSIAKWRKMRPTKSLYELQIEACELGLKKLAKAKGVSKEEKAAARKKIEAEIALLKRKKAGVFLESSSFNELDIYTAEEAMKIRKRFRSKSE